MSFAKTTEPIEMPFATWTCVGPRNNVLGEDPKPLLNGEGQFFLGGGHIPAH